MNNVWVTTTQPQLFAPIHMMQRMAKVNKCIVLVEAQFDKFHMRADIVGRGGPVRMRLPVSKAGRVPMNTLKVATPAEWAEHTKKQLQCTYGHTVGWKDAYTREYVLDIVNRIGVEGGSISDVGVWCYSMLAHILELPVSILYSTDVLPVRPVDPSMWIGQLTECVGGTDYMQGQSSMDSYMVRSAFYPHVRLWAQDFKVPEYKQLDGGFNPVVSILDPLFVLGRIKTIEMIHPTDPTVKEW